MKIAGYRGVAIFVGAHKDAHAVCAPGLNTAVRVEYGPPCTLTGGK